MRAARFPEANTHLVLASKHRVGYNARERTPMRLLYRPTRLLALVPTALVRCLPVVITCQGVLQQLQESPPQRRGRQLEEHRYHALRLVFHDHHYRLCLQP